MSKQVASTATCPRCRYDLTGLAPESPCPECRLPAAAINSPMPIVIAEPPQVRCLARLISLFGGVLVVWMPIGLLLSLIIKLGKIDHTHILIDIHLYAGHIAFLILGATATCVGWLDRSILQSRSRLRLWWLIVPAIAAIAHASSFLIGELLPPHLAVLLMDIAVIALVAGNMLVSCAALYFSRIARCAGESTQARRFKSLALILIVGYLFWFLAFSELLEGTLAVAILWWIEYAFAFAYIALGLLAIRLARHLRGPVVDEALRVREHS